MVLSAKEWMKRSLVRTLQITMPFVYRVFPSIRDLRWALQRIIDLKITLRRRSIRHNLQSLVPQVSLDDDLLEIAKKIKFATHPLPRVSIIIPVYNKIEYTLTCLLSLCQHATDYPYEVIVVNDHSTDATESIMQLIENVVLINNDTNIGFLRNCNLGAAVAKGDLLLFLNNDVNLLEGWLDNLVQTIDTVDNAGLVGSKLIYSNGILQEAGGVIWQDGSGMNYGRGEHPDHPKFNYLRDTDYVSGASIIIRKETFERLNGFDEVFIPAYYEDTDLCFKVREIANMRVLYQPRSAIVHYEGISSGTDLSSGVKRHQAINHPVFRAKWETALSHHYDKGHTPTRAHDRLANRHILVIDHKIPMPDQDSGSIDMQNILSIMANDIGRVHFFPLRNRKYIDRYQKPLEILGVECAHAPFYGSLRGFIDERSHLITDVWLSRCSIAGGTIDLVRKMLPNANVIFHTVDLHFLRESRQQSVVHGRTLALAHLAEREFEIMRKVDRTVVISQHEAEILASHGIRNVHVLPLVRSFQPPIARSFADRRGVLFFGGFEHQPNVDAVDYLVNKIWPEVRDLCQARSIPSIPLIIAGSKMPSRFGAFESRDIKPIGYVQDTTQLFSEVRLSAAPLRYGAGLKGKVLSSVAEGVPVVGTEIAFEGFPLVKRNDASSPFKLGNTAGEIASLIVALYDDDAWWSAASVAGIRYARTHFAFDDARARIAQIMDFPFADRAR